MSGEVLGRHPGVFLAYLGTKIALGVPGWRQDELKMRPDEAKFREAPCAIFEVFWTLVIYEYEL